MTVFLSAWSAFRPDGVRPGAPGHCSTHHFLRQPVSTWRHDALERIPTWRSQAGRSRSLSGASFFPSAGIHLTAW